MIYQWLSFTELITEVFNETYQSLRKKVSAKHHSRLNQQCTDSTNTLVWLVGAHLLKCNLKLNFVKIQPTSSHAWRGAVNTKLGPCEDMVTLVLIRELAVYSVSLTGCPVDCVHEQRPPGTRCRRYYYPRNFGATTGCSNTFPGKDISCLTRL